ncbi:MAG: ATP-binding protein [Desulfobacterales bacterium]|uniref:ATP-binding protein n=1 Tax=Candidatus Desulfatibia profunda TaxID=2841695 RepID=A0A8J6NUT6_9BACT|nr:ATP-binding protein [Candidatus Desulfatibia profunda]MBL7181014.1 ATP-binding protein [Desulfobacterales bacterium]
MSEYIYERPIVNKLIQGFREEKKLLLIITGPRQTGKTTAALQVADKWKGPVVNATADLPIPPGPEWIRAQWNLAEGKAKSNKGGQPGVLLILDEVQKVPGWSEVVKELWDLECRKREGINVIILGSSSLLIQKGLTESLAGRFFLHRCTHWGFDEMEKAFSWNLDKWLFYGGYPGAAPFIGDEEKWSQYVTDSLIETVLAKDVLQLQTVAKPALLRQLFMLAAVHPAQILSYNKMLGQLHDAGNTTTLAHYLKLLASAFLISGIELFRHGKLAKRGSSPKLIIWNNSMINALIGQKFENARQNYSWWGRLVENAVGAHLLNHLTGLPYSLYYWRKKGLEVDFVIKTPLNLWALEIKSGKPQNPKGVAEFCRLYQDARPLIIGSQGMPFDEFFRTNPKEVFL